MPITIQGIRIDGVSITQDDGVNKVTSSYALLSSTNKVLAKQSVGGYSDMKVEPAADTMKVLNEFLVLYKRDVESVLGLTVE